MQVAVGKEEEEGWQSRVVLGMSICLQLGVHRASSLWQGLFFHGFFFMGDFGDIDSHSGDIHSHTLDRSSYRF
jgi:hypothetical protein